MATSVAKHPKGLYVLFFTEMWERLSYYGMRALLVLFMVDAVESGGMGSGLASCTPSREVKSATLVMPSLRSRSSAAGSIPASLASWSIIGGLNAMTD